MQAGSDRSYPVSLVAQLRDVFTFAETQRACQVGIVWAWQHSSTVAHPASPTHAGHTEAISSFLDGQPSTDVVEELCNQLHR